MANELKHKDIGSELTKAEFEDVTLHQLDLQAIGDLIKATSATQLSRLPIGSNDQVLTVVSGVPAWATPSGGTKIASGTYTGNGSGDRAIAHGLGVVPKAVFIYGYYSTITQQGWFRIIKGTHITFAPPTGGALVGTVVTVWTATNFYVGGGSNTANGITELYCWVAIG